jgi:protein gp37
VAEKSSIEWCDATFNPWIGCTKVSPGCDNCYAARQDAFRHWTPAGWGAGQPRKRTKTWDDPIKWNGRPFYECANCAHPECRWRGEGDGESCPSCGGSVVPARRRVFCASLADVFDNEVDPAWRYDLFNLILSTPNLDWLLLTKRIGNAARMIEETLPANMKALPPDCPVAWPWPNVWIGATIVNQEEADRDIPKLLAVPARVRFLSMEPLLGPVSLVDTLWRQATGADWLGDPPAHLEGRGPTPVSLVRVPGIDWVIAGGESGRGARPMHPQWARSLRDQCADAGVPFMFKQWGEWAPTESLEYVGAQRLHPDGSFDGMFKSADAFVRKAGKKAAGRLLDGVEHNGFPEATHA